MAKKGCKSQATKFKPLDYAGSICEKYPLAYSPNHSMYLYKPEGYWQAIHASHVERLAMVALGPYAKAHQCSEIRKMVELSCLLPLDRDFDEHNGYVNVKNGMLDLHKRELLAHDREYYSTIQLQVAHEPAAKCPRWEQFLDEILEGDQECIDIIQEFMGYSLVPDTRYQKALLLVGEGANGKSTLLTVWEKMLGPENTCSVTLGNLSNEFHRVNLKGKLLNIAAEIKFSTIEESDYFKRIVAGDTIDGAYKRQDPFHFRPFARLVFAMNRMPRVKDTSHGFYRRLLIIPFNRMFPPDEADKNLTAALLKELNGIFAWALRGLDRLYQNDGFMDSRTTREALQEYQRMNNPVVAFVEDKCDLDPEGYTSKELLYSEYREYTKDYGYAAASQNTFFRELYAVFPALKAARIGPRDHREHHIAGINLVKSI